MGLGALGPASAALMGCVGRAPLVSLLALIRSVQNCLAMACPAVHCPVGGLHAVHHCAVLQRQKLSKGEGGSPVQGQKGGQHSCRQGYKSLAIMES